MQKINKLDYSQIDKKETSYSLHLQICRIGFLVLDIPLMYFIFEAYTSIDNSNEFMVILNLLFILVGGPCSLVMILLIIYPQKIVLPFYYKKYKSLLPVFPTGSISDYEVIGNVSVQSGSYDSAYKKLLREVHKLKPDALLDLKHNFATSNHATSTIRNNKVTVSNAVREIHTLQAFMIKSTS